VTDINADDITEEVEYAPLTIDEDTSSSRKGFFGRLGATFSDMTWLVRFSTIWLVLITIGAIYAKLDVSVFNGAIDVKFGSWAPFDYDLPLQDPNAQVNGFDPATGTFGDGEPIEPISGEHWLGTDAIARDTFSRILHGAWVSLAVAAVAVAFGVVIGGFLGALAGFVRGRTETIIMATLDVILAFPALVLLLAMVSIFRVRSLTVIALVIGFLGIPIYTRVARANSLAISNREFVAAARAIGTKPRTILFREVIPNVLPSIIAYAMVAAALVIVVEGTLSFLGLSVPLPQSSWGNMINLGRRDIKINITQVLWPSLALTFTVLALNQVGDWFQQRSAVRSAAL